MIASLDPILQALLGTLFTWGMTGVGACLCFFVKGSARKVLDFFLGMAAGIMLAASYWSLLEPAIEMSDSYGRARAVPALLGFFLGACFVFLSSKWLPDPASIGFLCAPQNPRVHPSTRPAEKTTEDESWKRVMLLVLAITVHNAPEGLAVGVAFGAAGSTAEATFDSACKLAIGIGLQNFPEGFAVSMPLKRLGVSSWKAFFWGQLSGLVEPFFGVLGAWLVLSMRVILPYSMAFAAGAMVFVVVNDLVPEARANGNIMIASWGVIVGFMLMMGMDVTL